MLFWGAVWCSGWLLAYLVRVPCWVLVKKLLGVLKVVVAGGAYLATRKVWWQWQLVRWWSIWLVKVPLGVPKVQWQLLAVLVSRLSQVGGAARLAVGRRYFLTTNNKTVKNT